jgi:hypothetical protein
MIQKIMRCMQSRPGLLYLRFYENYDLLGCNAICSGKVPSSYLSYSLTLTVEKIHFSQRLLMNLYRAKRGYYTENYILFVGRMCSCELIKDG